MDTILLISAEFEQTFEERKVLRRKRNSISTAEGRSMANFAYPFHCGIMATI
jgi:hypothetical protein